MLRYDVPTIESVTDRCLTDGLQELCRRAFVERMVLSINIEFGPYIYCQQTGRICTNAVKNIVGSN